MSTTYAGGIHETPGQLHEVPQAPSVRPWGPPVRHPKELAMRHLRDHPQDALRDIHEPLVTIHEPPRPHTRRPSMRPPQDLVDLFKPQQP